MKRPVPTPLYHFTHVSHLASIVKDGLLSDTDAVRTGALIVEVGNAGIKERRHGRIVPIVSDGAMSDYVPLYFAPLSPIMYAVHRGNVPTNGELGSCIDSLVRLGPHGAGVLVRHSSGRGNTDQCQAPVVFLTTWTECR